jgi:nucleotide-binding universal stress UspA family protein
LKEREIAVFGFTSPWRIIMFKNILVPLDGSPMADRILPNVAATAQIGAPPETITLLRILETDGVEFTAIDPLTWKFARDEAQVHLDEAARQLAQFGLTCNTALLEGKAAQRIVEYLHTHDVDLLVLSSHGHGGLSGWNVSGVAQKVIHRAGTSILLVRSSSESAEEYGEEDARVVQYHHILAPLDGSQRAESALPLAGALAEHHGAELVVVHVARRPEMIQRVPLSQEDAALAERVVERNTMEADKYFAQLQSRLPARIESHIIVDDSVTRALHQFAEQEEIDLVVLSAHGHACHSRLPYSALVNSFITYGVTSLLILQDLPFNEITSARIEPVAEDVTMPARRANEEEGLNERARFEI